MSKKISLACDICKSKNYRVHKSSEERLHLKKFCKKCKIQSMHKEEK